MKNLILFCFLILFFENIYAQAPFLQWTRQEAITIGKLIQHDNEGNIVVCGIYGADFTFDGGDIITIKYDSNGNKIWQAIYTDTINSGIKEPFDMVIDTIGNIYVTGRTHVTNSGLPITPESIILKYDKNGNLIWDREYGYSVGLQGGARKIRLFENRIIFIAGYMDLISGSNNKCFLASYDTSGNLLWAQTDSNSYETIGRDVEVDKNQNVYMIGTSACCTPGYKMMVSRFDSTGNKLWTTILYDSAHIYAYTWEGTIDDSSNIYLTAETKDTTFSTGYDCAIAKVDSSGNQKWFSVYSANSNPQYWDESTDIETGSSHDVYVCGTSQYQNGYGPQSFLIKLNINGNISWAHSFNDTILTKDAYTAISFDSLKNLIVLGEATFLPDSEELIINCIDTAGNEIWRVEKPGYYYESSLCLLKNSIYATGSLWQNTPTNTDDSLFVLKYSNSPINLIPLFPNEPIIKIFPNPFNDKIKIEFGDNILNMSFYELIIYDAKGDVLISKKIFNGDSIFTNQISKGIYWLKIITPQYIYVKKIIKL